MAYGAPEFQADMASGDSEITDLELFRALIADWGTRMNLVGPTALDRFWDRHVLDSAQLFHVEQGCRVWLDVGAGAGFPGVVLAILLKHRGGGPVHLVESMAKRVGFLHAVVDGLALPAVVHHARAEDVTRPEGLDVVTARACAPLPRLLDYTHHLLRRGTRGVFLKGRGVESELTEARRSWTFEANLTPSRSDPEGRILTIERLARRGR